MLSKRVRRARIAPRAALSLFIGAVVTVLVSWAGALLTVTHPAAPESWWFRHDGVEWWVNREKGVGAFVTECSGRFTGWDPAHPSVIDLQARAVNALDPLGILVSRSRAIRSAKSATALRWRDEAHGWPFLALRCELADPDGQPVLRGGLSVSRLDPRKGSRAAILPLIPMWAGLAADAAIFGAGFGLLMLAASGLRRELRRRRGHCPRCGYTLSGLPAPGVCPECGAAP